jgi:hypothetical protein
VPESLTKIFREAIGCAESGYLVAAAMMCRRTLEGICNHYIPDLKHLGLGLDDLHKAKIIDDRFFEWAEALRKDGNLAAHGGDPRYPNKTWTISLSSPRQFSTMFLCSARDLRFTEYAAKKP